MSIETRRAIAALLVSASIFGCSFFGAAQAWAGMSADAPVSPPREFCRVDMPESWAKALSAGEAWTEGAGQSLTKLASPDGESAFVQVTTPQGRSLVWRHKNGMAESTVMTLADAREEQFIAGGFDGRWLVFAVGHDRRQPSDWTVHIWDSASSAPPRMIADNRHGPKSPWIRPVIHGGRVAWLAGAPQMQADVHLFDLATQEDRVVHRGAATEVFFLGDALVWRDGYETELAPLRAVDAATGHPLELPEAARQVHSLRHASAGAGTLAWVEPRSRAPLRQAVHSTSLKVRRSEWTAARTIVSTDAPDETLEWPTIAGDLVGWGNLKAFFVADTRSGSYVQITPHFGSVEAWGDALLVHFHETDRRRGTRSSIVRASELPALPRCDTSARPQDD